MTPSRRTVLATLAGGAAAAAFLPRRADAQSIRTEKTRARVVEVAKDFEFPWGLAFLPDGSMLVTERDGHLRRVGADGRKSDPIKGVPEVVVRGQGGLLDVALDPQFDRNRLVYLSYTEGGQGGSGTAVTRATFDGGGALADPQIIFRQTPKANTTRHFGCRLVFAPDGTLFIGMGDRGMGDPAQKLDTTIGKLVRIRPDGSIPPDNPYLKDKSARPELYSIGHRNIQGAALHPVSKRLWTVEHGAKGGDEINIPLPGRNYGWPVISFGVDYSGAKIGVGTHKAGMEQPNHYWDPSIAPSGMAFYTADRFPAWKGNLFIGSLKFSQLVRLELDGDKVLGEERMLDEVGQRIRDVRQGPDGLLYLLTDHSGGQLLRIEPA